MRRFVPRKHRSALMLCVFAVLVTGCGHGHGHSRKGTLEVFNSRFSAASIDGVETVRASGGSARFEPIVATPGTGVFFDRKAGYYDVVVFWDTGSRDTYFDVDIDYARTTTLNVRF